MVNAPFPVIISAVAEDKRILSKAHIYMTLTCNVNSIMLYGAVYTMKRGGTVDPRCLSPHLRELIRREAAECNEKNSYTDLILSLFETATGILSQK